MSTISMYQYHPELKDSNVSSGWMIKSTRELRKLSVESLSQTTEITKERIVAAEANQARLDTEEFERLAMALDCHPSFFAFPYWDSVPFKSEPVVVSSSARVNTESVIREVRVYLNRETGITIPLLPRKSLHVHTFNGAMASPMTYGIRQDIRYRCIGDNLGLLNDNYGSGPDFDCDNRVITELEIKIHCTANGIRYGFEGLAVDAGGVSTGRPTNSPVGDWTFGVSFLVPLELLRSFCGLYPEAAERLISRLKGYAA
jgi:transcriptional regulator with XRE-family HTH domain